MPTELEQRARDLRGIGSAIIEALAQIVNAPQTDEQCDAEVIPRAFVMDQVIRIREQFDKLGPIADALQQAQQPSEPMFTASMYGSAEAARKAREEWDAQQPGDDTWMDDQGTTWCRPTAWAYAQVCKARDKLQAFKSYVHERLDAMDVPHTVPSPHTDAGCRIGGRLDWIEQRIAQQPGAQAVAWSPKLDEICGTVPREQRFPDWAIAHVVRKLGNTAWTGETIMQQAALHAASQTPPYTHPQPPSIPEPSGEDVEAALSEFHDWTSATEEEREDAQQLVGMYHALMIDRRAYGNE